MFAKYVAFLLLKNNTDAATFFVGKTGLHMNLFFEMDLVTSPSVTVLVFEFSF